MEFTNVKHINSHQTADILKKCEHKENMSGISLSSARSKKAGVNIQKTLEDYNRKFEFKFSTDELNSIKLGENPSKNDILKSMISYKM